MNCSNSFWREIPLQLLKTKQREPESLCLQLSPNNESKGTCPLAEDCGGVLGVFLVFKGPCLRWKRLKSLSSDGLAVAGARLGWRWLDLEIAILCWPTVEWSGRVGPCGHNVSVLMPSAMQQGSGVGNYVLWTCIECESIEMSAW